MNRANHRRFLHAYWPLGLVLELWAVAAAASAPPGRYSIPGDGTVHDTKTGLVWQQAVAPGIYTWTQAGSYCGGLSLAGLSWRLPSVKELMTLTDFTVASPGPTIDVIAFPNTPTFQNVTWLVPFWSSSPLASDPSSAWFVDFGGNGSNTRAVSDQILLRCVH